MIEQSSAAVLRANVCSVYVRIVRIKWVKDTVGAIPTNCLSQYARLFSPQFSPHGVSTYTIELCL